MNDMKEVTYSEDDAGDMKDFFEGDCLVNGNNFPEAMLKSANALVSLAEMKSDIKGNLLYQAIDDLVRQAIQTAEGDKDDPKTFLEKRPAFFKERLADYQVDARQCMQSMKAAKRAILKLCRLDKSEYRKKDIQQKVHQYQDFQKKYLCNKVYIKALKRLIKDQMSPGKSLYTQNIILHMPCEAYRKALGLPTSGEADVKEG